MLTAFHIHAESAAAAAAAKLASVRKKLGRPACSSQVAADTQTYDMLLLWRRKVASQHC
jgi:hypothetical protein